MSADGQRTKWCRNIAENFNRLSRAHERYRQTTGGRTMTYSEHELEFTFAKNCVCWYTVLSLGEANIRCLAALPSRKNTDVLTSAPLSI